MKRPASITAIAICQGIVGALTILWVLFGPAFASGFPAWFANWSLAVGLVHVISAIALFRLSWFGPISFLLAWIASQVVGHVFVPVGARPTMAGVVVSVAILVGYCFAVLSNRGSLSPNNSFKPTAGVGPNQ